MVEIDEIVNYATETPDIDHVIIILEFIGVTVFLSNLSRVDFGCSVRWGADPLLGVGFVGVD